MLIEVKDSEVRLFTKRGGKPGRIVVEGTLDDVIRALEVRETQRRRDASREAAIAAAGQPPKTRLLTAGEIALALADIVTAMGDGEGEKD